jgi:hypothetical protein
MGNIGTKLLPQAQRTVNWNLSAAKEAEKAAMRLRQEYKEMSKKDSEAFPPLGAKNDDVIHQMNQISKLGDCHGETRMRLTCGP